VADQEVSGSAVASDSKPVVNRRIVVVGAGGFGRETLDVIEDITSSGRERYEIVGVVDSLNPAALERLRDREVRYLGDDDWLRNADADFFSVGIGDPHTRRRLVDLYLAAGLRPATLVHPTASVGRRTSLGEGAIVCAGAAISTNVQIGAYATVNPNATIGHDARLGDYVSINPGAIISGEVSVGKCTLVGAGAVVLEKLSVGQSSVVGAMACVTRDVADRSTVKGVPAR
jgi:sugar O-acyltransferase (sialic acid O-acetyltransferase NeuD family)